MMVKNSAPPTNKPAFLLKGSLFTLTILQILETDPTKFVTQLKEMVEKAPQFFLNAPIVIDLQNLRPACQIDFEIMKTLLREHQLIPIAICGGNEAQQQAAVAAKLAILPSSKHHHDIKPKGSSEEAQKETVLTPGAKIITQPVRSGQQIYAKNTDLIIVSTVSHGAEILADGNIHVYGTLRGRALAGINGNKEARIFCQKLEAELLSIAGLYLLSDDFLHNEYNKPIQIYLESEKLQISELS